MATTITIKKGNNARAITDTLVIGTTAIDLTGATVVLVLRLASSSADDAIRQAATITDAAAGQVSADLPADVYGTAGQYYLEWEITFSDDTVLSVPDSEYHVLEVLNDLG